jgi:hypothetical protein
MGDGFLLKLSPLRLLREIVRKRPIDVAWVRVVPFNKIGIITVHGTYEVTNRTSQNWANTASQLIGLANQRQDFISKGALFVRGHQRFHKCDIHTVFNAGFRAACKAMKINTVRVFR